MLQDLIKARTYLDFEIDALKEEIKDELVPTGV